MKYLLFFLLSIFSVTVFAEPLPMFQAGNILTQTPPYPIDNNSGVASYYADGTQGQIKFTCKLSGDESGPEIHAWLTPGKNFANSDNPVYTALSVGTNGPYTWTLTNTGENNGNIKVFYLTGNDVTVQCIGETVSQ